MHNSFDRALHTRRERKLYEYLRSQIKALGAEPDESALIELINYSRHMFVREMRKRDLKRVLLGIATHALRQRAQVSLEPSVDRPLLGGGGVRQAISKLCDDPFSDCSIAARNMLGAFEDRPGPAERSE